MMAPSDVKKPEIWPWAARPISKGAMVFHMLRWEVGDAMFKKIMIGALSQYTDKPMRSSEFEKVAEAQSQMQLTTVCRSRRGAALVYAVEEVPQDLVGD